MSSIRISEKHGINPTISVCFWCGKEKNEIVLLGKLPGDKEAPMQAVLDYEPCDTCKDNMACGITFMESLDGKTPTGRWFVLTEEATKRIFGIEDLEKDIPKRKAYIDKEAFDMLMNNREKE